MSTVRIQVRRGLASEWTTANPVLAAGEMGVETNTNKFKFGNGSSTWTALSYAAADTAGIGEISQDAIDQALSMGAGLTKTYDDGANTITITVDTDVISTKAFATSEASNAQTAAIAAAEEYTDSAISGVNNSLSGYLETGDRGTANGVASLNAFGKILESELELTNLQTHISTEGDITGQNFVVNGSLVVSGTTTTVNTENVSFADPIFLIAQDNTTNMLDLGFVANHNTGVDNHTGLVRDASEDKWKLFKGVIDDPTTTVNFSQGSLDTLELGRVESAQAEIVDLTVTGTAGLPADSIVTAFIVNDAVTADKIASNAVTSAKILNDAVTSEKILNGAITENKIANNAVVSDKIVSDAITTEKIASAAVTSEEIASSAVTTAKIADSAVDSNKIANDSVSTSKIGNNQVTADKLALGAVSNSQINDAAEIAQSKIAGLEDDLALLATKEAPTFTGLVVLPESTTIGNVDATEITHLNGVTSSIQTQFESAATALLNHASDTTNIHGIADTSLLATTAYVDSAEADAITAAGTAADSKVAAAVAALTKSSVGLDEVDNTSDADKPISTATQDALDLKAPLAGPSFTGDANFEGSVTIEGNLVVEGTTTTVNTSEVQIDDPLFYLAANQYDTNTRDIGITGAYGTVGGTEENHLHTGLVKDVTDGKWKLFSNTPHPVNNVVDFTSAAYDTLKLGSLEATTVTPSSGVVFSDGTQTKQGVPSLTTIGTTIAGAYNLSTGGLALRDQLIPVSGAHTITVPANATTAYPVGASISFYQSAGTDAAFAEAAGVTILRTPGLKLRATGSSATITKVATDTWLLAGDLKA
jgi:hypothetical protein